MATGREITSSKFIMSAPLSRCVANKTISVVYPCIRSQLHAPKQNLSEDDQPIPNPSSQHPGAGTFPATSPHQASQPQTHPPSQSPVSHRTCLPVSVTHYYLTPSEATYLTNFPSVPAQQSTYMTPIPKPQTTDHKPPPIYNRNNDHLPHP